VVEAPASKPIAFVAEAVNALRVVITDSKGALAKAGLKSGDAIVAVDGREFGNRQQLDWIRQSLKGELVTLTVNRGDELLEIVVPRSFLSDARAAGGRFREGAR
jgi:C-terminal processing protease CtpA/Prc